MSKNNSGALAKLLGAVSVAGAAALSCFLVKKANEYLSATPIDEEDLSDLDGEDFSEQPEEPSGEAQT